VDGLKLNGADGAENKGGGAKSSLHFKDWKVQAAFSCPHITKSH